MTATYSHQAAQRNTYFEQQIQTATREQLLLMLYDGAIRFLKLAQQGLADNDVEKTHNNLVKTQKIISEFIASLDVEMGGETASNLLRLYEYFHHRLVEANLKKDTAAIAEVLEHLQELRKTWAQAVKLAKQEAKQEQFSAEETEDNEGCSDQLPIEGAVRYGA